ncbi:MAG TPA: hypothetical protein VFZ09_26500 [Archangium sp.]|uniref:hypothetical protein n=1 Tax=Archangium sp. TaxID=1872627 RepID=UPI002E37F43E|nr:hypothetical protein [Archangium sp.]HEX5749809.1 hypothetical protein [Archangium sp.]
MLPNRILASLLSSLALVLSACPPPDSPTPDAGVLPDVSGQRAVLSMTSTGEVRIPVDLSAAPPQALVLEGDTFVTYPGEGRADGTFTIPNVPAGTYYLRAEPNFFVVTDSRRLELSTELLGRPDAVTQPADAGAAEVVFELDNLHPYQATDGITLFSLNANVARFRLTPSIATAATSGSFTYTVRAGQPLVDPARGDRGLLTQLTSRTATPEGTSETLPYRSVSRFLEAPEFQARPGERQTLSGTLTEPPALTASIHWDLASYRNLASAVHPRATVVSEAMVFDVLPAPLSYSYRSLLPRLFELAQGPSVAQMHATFTYANPYPASWNAVGVAAVRYAVPYQLPGTTSPVVLFGGASITDTLPSLLSKTIAFPYGPVLQPRIGGQDARQPVTLNTTTPELSWTAPVSLPDMHYIVFVQELSAQGSATVSRLVGTLLTDDTRLRLPPGLLSSGKSYVFTFDVNTTPGNDLLRQVFLRLPIPITGVETLSEIVTVE